MWILFRLGFSGWVCGRCSWLFFLIVQVVTKEDQWGFHSAKVNCVSWSPDSSLVASGSLDTSIIVWSVEKPNKHLIIKSKDSFHWMLISLLFLTASLKTLQLRKCFMRESAILFSMTSSMILVSKPKRPRRNGNWGYIFFIFFGYHFFLNELLIDE